jgi:hypothetical protein
VTNPNLRNGAEYSTRSRSFWKHERDSLPAKLVVDIRASRQLPISESAIGKLTHKQRVGKASNLETRLPQRLPTRPYRDSPFSEKQDDMKRRSERALSGFSLTPERRAYYSRRAQFARSSERVKARQASTNYLRWLSVPHSPKELAKYPVPTTVAELRKIQAAFSTVED